MHFTPSHEWIKIHDDIGTVGITLYAQKELGEVVYVELPTIGKKVKKGQELAVLESTKAAADIYAPVSGEIVEVNTELEDNCDRINSSPESEGWLCKIRLDNIAELADLIDHKKYHELTK
jgi:glycine cleavage system H protein